MRQPKLSNPPDLNALADCYEFHLARLAQHRLFRFTIDLRHIVPKTQMKRLQREARYAQG